MMGEETGISWCDHTWNPWRGCEKVSAGCDHCYAEEMSRRSPKTLGEWGKDGNRARGADSYMQLPLKWAKAAREAGVRRRVFCLSLGDWLEDRLDLDGGRIIILNAIARTPELDWLLLTKRPESFDPLMRRAISRVPGREDRFDDAVCLGSAWICGTPPANVWALTSVENQEYADLRIAHLLKIPAAVHGLSIEPMLGPVDLSRWAWPFEIGRDEDGNDLGYAGGGSDIDWVICGAESGKRRRPFELEWAYSLRDQCGGAAISFFMKQDSHQKPGQRGRIPDDLWIKEFPNDVQRMEAP